VKEQGVDVPAENYNLGDMVWSRTNLQNDGSIPDLKPDEALACAGARGVVVRVGSLENSPEISVYLVRFEDASGALGEPVGCFGNELTQDEALAATLSRGATR
jgi:nitrogen fixation protein NifZ